MEDKKQTGVEQEENKPAVVAMEGEVVNEADDEDNLIVSLSKKITFEGKDYTKIDLTGLRNLTGKDLKKADRWFRQHGGGTGTEILPEADAGYDFYIASIASGLPMELFDELSYSDARRVKGRITGFSFRAG